MIFSLPSASNPSGFSLTLSEQVVGQYTNANLSVSAASGKVEITTTASAPAGSVAIAAARARASATAVPGTEHVTAPGIDRALLQGQSIAFSDGVLAFDRAAFEPPATDLPMIFRLYETALGRVPDALGENNWNGRVNQGLLLANLANDFLNSAEHQLVFGNQTDMAFVTQLYQDGLGRAPDANGQSAYLGALASGASRAQVLISISQSPEAMNHNAAIASAGVFTPAP